MRITDVYVGYLKITRIIQIGSILVKHGFKEMISHTFLGRRIRKRRIRQHKPVYTTQERLRLTIEDLGPTYIKFGQILADRPDILSERFRKELKKLQTNALPFDDHLAIRLIEDELGAEIKDVFSEFNPHCIASASIGQVYTGRLKNGKDVVIKIRRPNIDQKIKLDLYLMRYLAKKLALEYPEMAAINIVGVVDEFGESIFKELNYYNEATNILRFRDIFKDNPRIYIPHVDMKHTTHRMLIMERIFGMSPDDPLQLKAAGLDPVQIALNGAEALLIMVFKEGFFHADPHAGNLFILPGNRVAFIDFGMVGALRPREMDFLANLSIGFARRDPIGLADSMIRLCDQRFFDQRDDLIFSLQQMIKRFSQLPIEIQLRQDDPGLYRPDHQIRTLSAYRYFYAGQSVGHNPESGRTSGPGHPLCQAHHPLRQRGCHDSIFSAKDGRLAFPNLKRICHPPANRSGRYQRDIIQTQTRRNQTRVTNHGCS